MDMSRLVVAFSNRMSMVYQWVFFLLRFISSVEWVEKTNTYCERQRPSCQRNDPAREQQPNVATRSMSDMSTAFSTKVSYSSILILYPSIHPMHYYGLLTLPALMNLTMVLGV